MMTEESITYPTIKLLNGATLDCYPLPKSKEKTNNEINLDTSGTYLSIGKAHPNITHERDINEHDDERIKLFIDNAFLFLQNRRSILSNSLMFLCPVPIKNDLAYTGTSGLNNPTLGVYLEWWLNCENTMIWKGDESKWLVFNFSGSPMSGINHCGIVDKNGTTDTVFISSFSSLWTSFMEINKRYDEAKSLYQSFTLEEVIETFKADGLSKIDDKDIHILFLENTIKLQNTNCEKRLKMLEKKYDIIKFQLLYKHREELKNFMTEYSEIEEKTSQRENEIAEECKELKCKLKSGIIDNTQYQKRLTPLKKEKEELVYFKRERFVSETLEKMFPDLCFNLNDITEFLEDPRSSEPLTSTKKKIIR